MNGSIIIASDHAGVEMKAAVAAELRRRGLSVTDAGPATADPVDYPDYAAAVAGQVSAAAFPRGVLICGSGIGMSIAANKFAGVRAGVCLTEEMAALSRRHNDANILVLPGRLIAVDEALRIVRTWLETPFEGGRHQRRLDKIAALESRPREK
jgi:ribose 5-phosphate isomerase B